VHPTHMSRRCLYATLSLRLWLAGVQIGFFALLAVEFAAHRGLLELVGIRTGSGLGFEF